jgi:crotonobetainyl-CoA:carnitine CoA-transferase CaiB-like acyl-CoA transferase
MRKIETVNNKNIIIDNSDGCLFIATNKDNTSIVLEFTKTETEAILEVLNQKEEDLVIVRIKTQDKKTIIVDNTDGHLFIATNKNVESVVLEFTQIETKAILEELIEKEEV